ncbi:MAG: AmmeMemoRadiSam system protein A [Candidatus Izemoplasmatales bacterium]
MALKAGFIVPHPPLIIPEIGKGQEREIQKTISAYLDIAKMIAEIKPETIVITTPHAHSYYDYFCMSKGESAFVDFSNYGASGVKFEVQYDNDFINSMNILTQKTDFPLTTEGKHESILDHASAIPLYFINKVYKDYKIVRFSLSGLPLETHYEFGKLIEEAISKSSKSVVMIASGDLSHKLKKSGPYGFSQEGLDFDKRFVEIVKSGNLEDLLNFDDNFLEKAAECGLRSFVIMAGILSAYNYEKKLLSYEGPFGVGYATASFTIENKKVLKHKLPSDSYVNLAKITIENYIKYKKVIKIPDDLPKEMLDNQAGVFVSLKKYGQLRGCIGTIEPTSKSIADEIIRNAISAATKDPRFNPVEENELDFLVISVDVLMEPTPVESLSELDVKKYGVIVSKGNRRGLLLPNIDGIDDPKTQIQIALKKAGILESDNYNLEKFEVTRHY